MLIYQQTNRCASLSANECKTDNDVVCDGSEWLPTTFKLIHGAHKNICQCKLVCIVWWECIFNAFDSDRIGNGQQTSMCNCKWFAIIVASTISTLWLCLSRWIAVWNKWNFLLSFKTIYTHTRARARTHAHKTEREREREKTRRGKIVLALAHFVRNDIKKVFPTARRIIANGREQ